MEKKPNDVQVNTVMADALVGVGNPEEALGIYSRTLKQKPDSVYPRVALGHAQKTLGDVKGAVESYRCAYKYKPDLGDAYWSLANLKTHKFSDRELSKMRVMEADVGVSVIDRTHFFCYRQVLGG